MSALDPANDWFPLEDHEHEAQAAALLRLLSPGPARVLDLGAGGGRMAVPLSRAGHAVTAVDTDEHALACCRRADPRIVTMHTDFASPGAPFAPGAFDAALCLGHTLMQLVDPLRALQAARNARRALAPSGVMLIDDLFTPVWRDVAEGLWTNGVSEDGRWQLVWQPGDAVIALRRGDRVDPEDWSVREDDTLLRLWTRGELALLAHGAGFLPPEDLPGEHLILLRCAP